MKKKAIKIAASTAVAASAFVAAAPVQQADAATNVNQLATNAQNAGTVLKWAISYEGSADFKTRPFNEFNAAKKAVAAAEVAANKLSATEKLAVQAKLVDAKVQIVRATAYIDAITSSEKIKSLTSNLTAATASGDLGKVETAYHAASFEYKKQAKLLDRVYGQSTRDGIRNAVKPAMESALDAVKYDVTVKMHLDKASALIKESKLEEAAAELAKADYNLTLKDAKFTFKSQLEKSYADVAASLPLQAISATGDGANTVTVKFSKAYTLDKNLTTLEAGQFKINGLTVQSAKLSEDKKSVILTTSTQKANTEYTVTWQGKSVTFKTAAVADTSGIAVNQTDVTYKESSESRTYEAKLTNTDGTAYVGAVTIDLDTLIPATGKTNDHTDAVITAVNGQAYSVNNTARTWTGVTDSNGNLVFTIAAATNASVNTPSVLYVQPTIKKLDGDKKTKVAAVTHFFRLQNANVIDTLTISDLHVDAANDYVFAEGFKYKWDNNDQFFIRNQKVTQDAFEAALSEGDDVSVDYKTSAANVSTWNIVKDVTLSKGVSFTNPKADVRFDGFNYDLSGKGQAGNTVKVYRGYDLMGTTTVNSDGTWTLRAVNLTQDVTNTFTAYQFLPGQDSATPWSATNVDSSKSVVISEGAFASKGISLKDNGDNGLSVTDELTFTFLNYDSTDKFKEDLTGTITVSDGLSKTAVFEVEYVNAKTLKVVKAVSAQEGFKNNSSTLTIESATGVVNEDELAYNVAVSKSKGTATIGGTTINPGAGVVSYTNTTVDATTDEVVKVTLPAGNTDFYKVKLFNSNTGAQVGTTQTTLVSKAYTATDLGVVTPGAANQSYIVRVYKEINGVDTQISSSVINNVDPVKAKLTSTTLTTDNAIAKTATLSAGDIKVDAKTAGVAGNNIKFAVVANGNNTPFTVEVTATDVTVNLPTDSGGAIVPTTLQQVVDKVKADANASALVNVSVDSAKAANAAVAYAQANLANGAAATDAVFAVTSDIALDTTKTAVNVTIGGKAYTGTAVYTGGTVATITIPGSQFTADATLAGKTIQAIDLVKTTGTGVDLTASTDVTL
ncbi:hypothetical protein [Psychrobacillus sp. FSL K6-2843]|uniref:hypothetical protein n=1 Tax=Psychrobacillus sp. FSL K6-2843 TaxID=2921549 RepID=UPI003159E86F